MTPKIFEIEGLLEPSQDLDGNYRVYLGTQTGLIIRYDDLGHQVMTEDNDIRSKVVSENYYRQLVNYWYLYYQKHRLRYPMRYQRAKHIYQQIFGK